MDKLALKKKRFSRRRIRVKKKVRKNTELFRLCISRSNKNFFAQIIDDSKGHTLVSSYEFSADWPNWELHPAGDEVVILLSGQATMLLQHEHGVEQIELLKANDCCVVPSNTWHTAKIADTAKMLFVTPGAGTVQRKA